MCSTAIFLSHHGFAELWKLSNFFFLISSILRTWTLKRHFSDRLPVHAFTILSCSSFAGRPRNILVRWSHGSSRTVINPQRSHHYTSLLPAVRCDCLVVSRLTQMKFKQMLFTDLTEDEEESSFFMLVHVHVPVPVQCPALVNTF